MTDSTSVPPTDDQLTTLTDNYVRGAIDTITFLNAVDDLWAGIDNSYAQAKYDVGADGGNEPELCRNCKRRKRGGSPT